MKYLKTTEAGTSHDYPYGRLQCTMTFSLEFNPKKGFRSVRQSVNPKTGRFNKPKKSTYSPIMLLIETDGFYSYESMHFYKDEELNAQMDKLSELFDRFTEQEIKYIYGTIYNFLKITTHSQVGYCGSDVNDVLKVMKPTVKKVLEGYKDPSKNIFKEIRLDHKALEALKVPDYQPFKVKEYQVI